MGTYSTFDPWVILREGFDAASLRESESVLALGNGFIGMRGNLEELTAEGAPTVQGTYLNGVFDSAPIVYGEGAFGYARNHETICSVADAKSFILLADGERLDMSSSRTEAHRRVLDMREGTLRRYFRWRTSAGALLEAESVRLVSLTRQELAAAGLTVRCLEGRCALEIRSPLSPAAAAEADSSDPRTAAGKDRRLITARVLAEDDVLAMEQRTRNSGFTVCCAAAHRSGLPHTSVCTDGGAVWTAHADLSAGQSVTVEKSICYLERRGELPDGLDAAADICRNAPALPELLAGQRQTLDAFWEAVGLEITGDDALLQGLRFNLFHLFQSVGRDGRRNVAAKGLTGEGYEGHYFWDTEAYILPVFLYTRPELARRLLEYRHSILPQARERARLLGHAGALFPWRTIDGEEVSAYYPAGTAQVHIDADIAHAVWEYYAVTDDLDFLAERGAELLTETARFYLDLGFFSEEKGGRFVINCVTGPDEYNVLVDNNVYTNAAARENLLNAARALELLRESRPEEHARLIRELSIDPEEPARWREAGERMYFPAPRDGIWPQDDGFLDRQPWPLDSIPADRRPLLLHYHPLDIYRRRICKQADLILAMTVFSESFTAEEKEKNFDFYDSVTTHDSSLSMAVFSILASEIGRSEKAYDYFTASVRLDLDDAYRNTKDGLHMANMAGTWNCVTKGFGGMRLKNGMLYFDPKCPAKWDGCAFRVRFRGRTIRVHMDRDGAAYSLLDGEPVTILTPAGELKLQ